MNTNLTSTNKKQATTTDGAKHDWQALTKCPFARLAMAFGFRIKPADHAQHPAADKR